MDGTEITIIGVLISAITTLSGVVAMLYRQQVEQGKITSTKLDDCEKDRESLWKAAAMAAGTGVEQLKQQIKNESGE